MVSPFENVTKFGAFIFIINCGTGQLCHDVLYAAGVSRNLIDLDGIDEEIQLSPPYADETFNVRLKAPNDELPAESAQILRTGNIHEGTN